LLPDSFPTPGNFRFQRGSRDLDWLVYRIIGERRLSGEDGSDLLGMLLSARGEDDKGMNDCQPRDEVLTLLPAGHDTTALALTWAWILLARHPRVEERLHSEITTALGTRPPTVADAPASQLRRTCCERDVAAVSNRVRDRP